MANILVVEDEKDIQQILSMLLEERGHKVFTASDGKIGVEKAIKEQLDLIVLDMFLPELNGIEVLNKIRQDPFAKKIPVLILTAATQFSTQSDKYWKDRFKVSGYMSKPINPLVFINKVDEILAGVPST